MESETPLLDGFNATIEGANFPDEVVKILKEAFMTGAACYERTLQVAIESNDPETVARIQDKMVDEITNRHTGETES